MGFSLEPDHPNCIAPGKRPMHTIIPGMMAAGDRAVLPFGVMGGGYQAAGHARFITNLLDFGLDAPPPMDIGRPFPPPREHEADDASGGPAPVQSKLERLGPRIK